MDTSFANKLAGSLENLVLFVTNVSPGFLLLAVILFMAFIVFTIWSNMRQLMTRVR